MILAFLTTFPNKGKIDTNLAYLISLKLLKLFQK